MRHRRSSRHAGRPRGCTPDTNQAGRQAAWPVWSWTARGVPSQGLQGGCQVMGCMAGGPMLRVHYSTTVPYYHSTVQLHYHSTTAHYDISSAFSSNTHTHITGKDPTEPMWSGASRRHCYIHVLHIRTPQAPIYKKHSTHSEKHSASATTSKSERLCVQFLGQEYCQKPLFCQPFCYKGTRTSDMCSLLDGLEALGCSITYRCMNSMMLFGMFPIGIFICCGIVTFMFNFLVNSS